MRAEATLVQPWTATSASPKPSVALRYQNWPLDLAITFVWALLGVAVVLADLSTPLRLIFGLPLVLFLPGYALASALFPRSDGPDGIERIGLGIGLSLATLPAAALVLEFSKLSVSTTWLTVALATACLTALAVAYVRRRNLEVADRYHSSIALPVLPNPRQWDRSIQLTAGIAVFSVLLLVAGAVPVVLDRLNGEELTEFAVYGENGQAGFYPRQLNVGEPAVVDLSVTNREGKTVSYALTITGAGEPAGELPTITLSDGETWRQPVQFTVTEEGQSLPVRFELRRADDPPESEPYRTLQLVVDGQASATSDLDQGSRYG